jgi:hypothetical protein
LWEEKEMASHCNGNKNKSRTFVYNFNETWENKYFFINVNNKCVCLICNTSVTVSKKCNVERHFMTMLKDYISKYPTLSLTLREEHRLMVFENRMLRRIFGPKRDEVTGGWRKLRNEELHGLHSSPSIVRVIKARRMRWAGNVAHMGEVRGAYNILVGRPEGRRLLGRPRRRWEDNIKMDLIEIGFGDVDWIHWAQDRDRWRAVLNTVMNLRVP